MDGSRSRLFLYSIGQTVVPDTWHSSTATASESEDSSAIATLHETVPFLHTSSTRDGPIDGTDLPGRRQTLSFSRNATRTEQTSRDDPSVDDINTDHHLRSSSLSTADRTDRTIQSDSHSYGTGEGENQSSRIVRNNIMKRKIFDDEWNRCLTGSSNRHIVMNRPKRNDISIDLLQRLRQELCPVKERFIESNTELEMNLKFLKKTILVGMSRTNDALHVHRFSGD